MNTKKSPNHPPTKVKSGGTGSRRQKREQKQSGIAIITVLSVLLLMSVLMLGFFSAATSELESSKYYASSLRTRQLTDIVTNMVIAQIREATAEEKGAGTHFTWASQPGCITTFSNRGTTYDSLAVAKYKLYSAADMQVDARENLAEDLTPDWNTRSAQYVDLNSPLYSQRQDELYFPIVDPRAQQSTNQTSPSNVEGFSYVSTSLNGNQIHGINLPGSDANSQRVPMPVQWLYILDDGTIGHLNEVNKFVATSGSGIAGSRNPIVARVAFWTDDESCKINVNTASEGVPWDIPRYDSAQEREYAMKQPVQRETSRFPGHPSMVSLSSVFFPHQDITEDRRKLKSIYDLVPKVEYNGSSASGSANTTGTTNAGVRWDNDRLFATYDEVLYRHKTGFGPRLENTTFTNNSISRKKLEQSRFFLTANSVAPELTLFGTPKMTMWPTYTSKPNTYFDDLITSISTIGNNYRKYYWQRNSSGSRHWEIYVNTSGHNLQLLDSYLMNLISPSNAIPGYGGSFGKKYRPGPYDDGKQILTQLWDYVRTTNLNDPYNRANQYTAFGNARGHGQVAGCCLCGGTTPHKTRWDKAGLRFPRGFGRLYTLSEVALVFKTTAERGVNGSSGRGYNWQLLAPGQVRVDVGILLETFCPSHGFTKMVPNSSLQIVGGRLGNIHPVPNGNPANRLADIRINGESTGYLRQNVTTAVTAFLPGFRGWGAHGGPRLFSTNALYFQKYTSGWDQQFAGGIPATPEGGKLKITVDGAPDRLPSSTPDMRIVLYDTNGGASSQDVNNLIQVFEIDFPNEFTIPVPKYSNQNTWAQIISSTRNNPSLLITDDMVVRSMVVSHSDFRLLCAKRVIENHVFQPHPNFGTAPNYDSGQKHAHSLVDPDGFKYTGFSNEREFIEGAGYSEKLTPDFPLSPENPNFFVDVRGNPRTDYKFSVDPMVTGDWDNGIAMQMDGPYVNRGDDGNQPSGNRNPYFDEASLSAENVTSHAYFSPNRVICGPGMFGSMSTGVQSGIPWRTLLFRPDPQHFGAANQPNVGDPPDHLFMDLFWMPVVEPYAISMPAATRGKINLNTQIVPFDYIKRNTAMHALMKAERVVAIPTNAGARYKKANGGSDRWRKKIDAYETMRQWEDKFKNNQLFRSPTEICEMYLVPEGEKLGTMSAKDYPNMRKFWEANRLTGDNTKERPYANMQPRLTTKSNVYRVHMIVQTLQKVRSSDATKFNSEKDKVTGQWRGSAIIERFIDPSDRNIPDYFNDRNFTKDSLEKFYNYRVLHLKQFAT
ncbi:MAG: Verru_Chthon cassette protein A [Verrucomicrobiales bacterium]